MSMVVNMLFGILFFVVCGLLILQERNEKMRQTVKKFWVQPSVEFSEKIFGYLVILIFAVALIVYVLDGVKTLIGHLSETTKNYIFIYIAGYAVAFFTSMLSVIGAFLSYNSIRLRNLRLVLLKRSFWGAGGFEEYDEPQEVSFKQHLKDCGKITLVMLFNSLLSWVQVILSIVLILPKLVKHFVEWLFLPSSVRLLRWQMNNIPFARAEDFIAKSTETGIIPSSEKIQEKKLKELSWKSECLTRHYAKEVFGEQEEKVEEYVQDAIRLTKEENDSVVVHPRFWAIPQTKVSAKAAIGKMYIPET
jgi:hypothetical protein